MDNINFYYNEAIDFVLGFLPKVLQAVVILWLGFWAIRKIMNSITPVFNKMEFSHEIKSFFISGIDVMLKVVLFFIVAGVFGINTASFVAVLAAAGFAVGMALQGSLGNFAAGIIVLLFKPYKVGDWIELDSKFGKVTDIQIFYTNVITPGNKQLIIPNGEMINGVIANYSKFDYIRIEQEVMMPYHEDFPRIQAIILNELKSIPKVLNEPKPEVGIIKFDTHAILLAVRPYVHPDDYWEVYFESFARIKKAYSDNDIKVAYSEGIELGNIGK